MISSWLFYWIMNDQHVTSLLTQNWLYGIALIGGIVFLETGLVVLPFFPGDSLLFTTGAFLGLSGISPVIPIVIITAAAIAGDSVNYSIGRSKIGQFILHRKWVKPSHIQRTHDFFARYGGAAVAIGRFIPILRTAVPFIAGMSEMNRRQFIIYNVLGGILWTSSILLAGVWLGQVVWIREHFSLLVAGIIVFSLVPVLLHVRPWSRKL